MSSGLAGTSSIGAEGISGTGSTTGSVTGSGRDTIGVSATGSTIGSAADVLLHDGDTGRMLFSTPSM